jgi:hypothetical protein
MRRVWIALRTAKKGLNWREFAREHPSGAEEAAEKLVTSGEITGKSPSAAKADVDSAGFTRGLKPPSPSGAIFSAACKARIDSKALAAPFDYAQGRLLKSCLFKALSFSAGSPAVLAVCLLAVSLPALGAAGPVLEVDFSNPGLTPAHWVLTISPDGNGHFRSERGSAPMDPTQGFEAANVDRDIKVSAGFAEHVFEAVHQHNNLSSECESHMKVAFQGWKKLTYSGPDGGGSCTFNYSKDRQIQMLGESLVAVAGTIVEGARLETLLQHDRLGLDKEMDYLMEAAGDGRVQQIGAIRGILERLADDTEVMERVRKHARQLLAHAEG